MNSSAKPEGYTESHARSDPNQRMMQINMNWKKCSNEIKIPDGWFADF